MVDRIFTSGPCIRQHLQSITGHDSSTVASVTRQSGASLHPPSHLPRTTLQHGKHLHDTVDEHHPLSFFILRLPLTFGCFTTILGKRHTHINQSQRTCSQVSLTSISSLHDSDVVKRRISIYRKAPTPGSNYTYSSVSPELLLHRYPCFLVNQRTRADSSSQLSGASWIPTYLATTLLPTYLASSNHSPMLVVDRWMAPTLTWSILPCSAAST